MGSPNEAQEDPDNSRCSPCPHVDDALKDFIVKYKDLAKNIHHLLIPCDGSVVTGVDDIGCQGHKNEKGQKKVADFIQPHLDSILK